MLTWHSMCSLLRRSAGTNVDVTAQQFLIATTTAHGSKLAGLDDYARHVVRFRTAPAALGRRRTQRYGVQQSLYHGVGWNMLALSGELLETTDRSVSATLGRTKNCAASASSCGEARLVAMPQREHKNGGSSIPSCRAIQSAQSLHKKAQKRWLFPLSG
jgi:hypothetical protein